MDITKIDQDITYVASVIGHVARSSEACLSVCSKYFICFRRILQAFFIWMFAHVSHICCKSMFKMFQLFQSYVAISVFMLQVVSVFHLLQTYVAFKYFMLQVFRIPEVCVTEPTKL
jgi:hypothetical protein